jgi:putative FmdB family regulatory protein
MPTYEYLCEKCEHEFEREQRITEPPVKSCPVCRSRKVKKLISQTSFVLKGGGWHADLYSRGRTSGSDTPSESSSEAASSPSSESGSEAASSPSSESSSEAASSASSESKKSTDTSSKKDSKKESQKKSAA